MKGKLVILLAISSISIGVVVKRRQAGLGWEEIFGRAPRTAMASFILLILLLSLADLGAGTLAGAFAGLIALTFWLSEANLITTAFGTLVEDWA